MPTTPNYALRYPSLTNAPNVPADMQNLATDTDTAVKGVSDLATRAPKVVLRRVAPHFTGTGADTVIQWDTADVNIGGMWVAGNASVVTLPKAGDYLVSLSAFWVTGNTSGARVAHIGLNGAAAANFIESDSRAANTGPEGRHPKITQAFSFAANDVLRGVVFQDSGASINLDVQFSLIYTRMSVTYLGSAT